MPEKKKRTPFQWFSEWAKRNKGKTSTAMGGLPGGWTNMPAGAMIEWQKANVRFEPSCNRIDATFLGSFVKLHLPAAVNHPADNDNDQQD